MKDICNEIISINNNYKNNKFYIVFVKKMSLKKFKDIINKNNEISIFIPLIVNSGKLIRFYEKKVKKDNIEDLLKNKEYKMLALIVKSFLCGGFFINDDFVLTKEKMEKEINKSELGKYISKYHEEYLNYRCNEKLDVFLNKYLIREF